MKGKNRGRTMALCGLLAVFLALGSCGRVEKHITVIVREQGSGTREAFDQAVTDGVHRLAETTSEGRRIYRTAKTAIQQTKTGAILSLVASDVHAIGYLSPDAVNDSVRVVRINGYLPTEENVLTGAYPICRPFVVAASPAGKRSPLAEDFLRYLMSDYGKIHVEAAGCVFLEEGSMRANEGETPVPVIPFNPLEALPQGEKLLLRGSSSMEKLIYSAARGYSEQYGVEAETLFDIQLEGSSAGIRAVERDTTGRVMGFSSASVRSGALFCFRICLDAVAVVVNQKNEAVTDLTLSQLYGIFSGEIRRFEELNEA